MVGVMLSSSFGSAGEDLPLGFLGNGAKPRQIILGNLDIPKVQSPTLPGPMGPMGLKGLEGFYVPSKGPHF